MRLSAILLALGLGAVTTVANAETTQTISQLIDRLPCPPPANDSIWRCPSVDRGFGLRLCRTSSRDISHVGLRLFSSSLRDSNDPVICNCIERLLLELSLQETHPTLGLKAWMKQYDVHLTANGYAYGRGSFVGLSYMFDILRNAAQIQINELETQYSVEVTSSKDHVCVMTFPKDRSLIWATDKKEEDQRIAALLAQSRGHRLPTASLLQSEQFGAGPETGVFQRKGNAYLIDRLRATTYYEKNTPQARPFFTAAHPELSLTNLMLLAAGSADIQVQLTHRVYGLIPINSQMRWADLMSVLCTQGTSLYAAARKVGQGNDLTGVLVMHNAHYGYIDMLIISANTAQLFNAAQPSLSATLYTNVPQNNVRDLFDDK